VKQEKESGRNVYGWVVRSEEEDNKMVTVMMFVMKKKEKDQKNAKKNDHGRCKNVSDECISYCFSPSTW
jgi:hypothetical protein